jgi:hydrogenase maturation protease
MNSQTSNNWKMLVIGWGNDLRGDDGAGVCAARAVADAHLPGVSVLQAHQLTPDLAEDIAGAGCVVFVDAYAAAADAPLRVEHISSAPKDHAIGHHGDPSLLLQLVIDLYGTVPDAWLIGIPAFNFQPGETLSPRTAFRTNEAVERIGKLRLGIAA